MARGGNHKASVLIASLLLLVSATSSSGAAQDVLCAACSSVLRSGVHYMTVSGGPRGSNEVFARLQTTACGNYSDYSYRKYGDDVRAAASSCGGLSFLSTGLNDAAIKWGIANVTAVDNRSSACVAKVNMSEAQFNLTLSTAAVYCNAAVQCSTPWASSGPDRQTLASLMTWLSPAVFGSYSQCLQLAAVGVLVVQASAFDERSLTLAMHLQPEAPQAVLTGITTAGPAQCTLMGAALPTEVTGYSTKVINVPILPDAVLQVVCQLPGSAAAITDANLTSTIHLHTSTGASYSAVLFHRPGSATASAAT